MAVYLAPIGSGLGDVIVCLPILNYLIKNESQKTFLVARSPRQLGFDSVIPGLTGTVKEPELKDLLKDEDRLLNLRDHELQTKWDWTSKEFQEEHPDANIYTILQKICNDKGINPDFESSHKLQSKSDPRGKGKILLVPSTTGIDKHLAEQTWINLLQKLEQENLETAILGEAQNSTVVSNLVMNGAKLIPTPNIEDAINVISSCKLVISVDTGLMHIALNQGIPTIALLPKRALYYRPDPACYPIFAQEQQVRGEMPKQGFPVSYDNFTWWDGEDSQGKRPISSITAEQIFEAIQPKLRLQN